MRSAPARSPILPSSLAPVHDSQTTPREALNLYRTIGHACIQRCVEYVYTGEPERAKHEQKRREGARPMSGLSVEQLRQFNDDGYVIVDDVIDVELFLDPMVAEYEEHLNELVHDLYRQAKCPPYTRGCHLANDLPVFTRRPGEAGSQYFDISFPLGRKIKPEEPCFFPPSVFHLLRSPGILDVVESLIGRRSTPVRCNMFASSRRRAL